MLFEPKNWVGEILDGRYRVIEKIGDGGMAHVYRAYAQRLDTDVAIKIPHDELLRKDGFIERFQFEAQSLIKFHHPHIVTILDVGNHEGYPYVVMRFLKGHNLQWKRLRKGDLSFEPMPPEILMTWLPQIARALDYVHQSGYVHRDVKPGNILFSESGEPFLTDFGIVKAVGKEHLEEIPSHTKTGMVFGTPAYVAPEVCAGQEYDGRCDQYSLAVTVYEMLAGIQPITGETPLAVLTNQRTEVPAPLSDLMPTLEPALCMAVMRGLSKNPDERFSGCVDFASDVTKGMSGYVAPTMPSGAQGDLHDQDATTIQADDHDGHGVSGKKKNESTDPLSESKVGNESVWSFVIVAIFLACLLGMFLWKMNQW